MAEFSILTDSCCDLPIQMVKELDITVLPLTFTMGGVSYQNHPDNRDMTSQDFYSRLRRGEMATTSAVNVGQFEEQMEILLKKGRDILVLAFSSALSTSCQSAQIAANDLQEQYPNRKIIVVDTLCASMGQGLLVYLAAQMQKKGATIQEVADWAEANRLNICHQFTVDELGFLKRGGRISATTAVVGTMLAVKPLLHVDDEGKLVSCGKARGRHSALRSLVKTMEETAQPDMDTIFISHGDCRTEIAETLADIKEKFPNATVKVAPIGPVIGAHAGPGTVAIFYMGTKR